MLPADPHTRPITLQSISTTTPSSAGQSITQLPAPPYPNISTLPRSKGCPTVGRLVYQFTAFRWPSYFLLLRKENVRHGNHNSSTVSYPEEVDSNPQIRRSLLSDLFSSKCSVQYILRSTFCIHLSLPASLIHIILHNIITLKIPGERYKWRRV
jgi:hypothetical protein